MILPAKYEWLNREPGPKMLLQMIRIYGVKEYPGGADNPVILAWAKELGIDKIYNDDAIPWCGLGVAITALRSNYTPPVGFLAALNWANFGTKIDKTQAMLGDVLVYKRKGGGHVTLYVGEDATHFHCMGANQSDSVNITRKAKNQVHAVRRAPFKIAAPPNIRKVFLSATGTPMSGKEV